MRLVHRDRSIHIDRECCLGPALADIWLLFPARIYKVSQLPLPLKFEK